MSRPYTPIYGDSVKITWENTPSTATPLAASNLNTESRKWIVSAERYIDSNQGCQLQ